MVVVQYVSGDPETEFFGLQIAKMFEAAGWKVSSAPVTFTGTFVYGVHVPDGNGAPTIRLAFQSIGLMFFVQPIQGGLIGYSGNGIDFGIRRRPGTVVVVGPKEPPTL